MASQILQICPEGYGHTHELLNYLTDLHVIELIMTMVWYDISPVWQLYCTIGRVAKNPSQIGTGNIQITTVGITITWHITRHVSEATSDFLQRITTYNCI